MKFVELVPALYTASAKGSTKSRKRTKSHSAKTHKSHKSTKK